MCNHVRDMRLRLDRWLHDENADKVVDVEFLGKMAEFLGFSVVYDEIPTLARSDNEDSSEKRLIITAITPQKEQHQEINYQVPLPLSPLAVITNVKKEIISPDMEISVDVPTSSPIKRPNKMADSLKKIITIAKDALETEINSYSKPPFQHKRISDIKISPLAMDMSGTAGNHMPIIDLNVTVTKTKDPNSVLNLTTLKATPKKKGAVIKPSNKENETATGASGKKATSSVSIKKSLLQPMHSNLQALRSKLRTPTQMKTSSSNLTRSAGTPARSALPTLPRGQTSERRLSVNATTSLKRETPLGFSRLRYPATAGK